MYPPPPGAGGPPGAPPGMPPGGSHGYPPPGAPGAYMPPTQPKKGGAGKVALFFGIGALVVLSVVGGVGYYFFGTSGTKVKSTAHTHLPKGCDVAMRIDVTALMKVKPVKEHVVAALEEVMKDEGGGRLAAFLVAARMDPKKDIHTMAVCLNDVKPGSDPDYGIVIGGKLLDEDGVIVALDRHDSADELKKPKKIGDLLVVEDKDGVLVSQSPEDAALLLSGDDKSLKAIAPKSDAFEEYDIPMDEQMVGVISSSAIKNFLASLGPFMPGTEELKRVGGVVVTMTLDPGELGLRMGFADKASAQKAKTELETMLSALALAPIGPTSDPAVKEALRKAKAKVKGKEVTLTIPISDESIEATCEEIADDIREKNDK